MKYLLSFIFAVLLCLNVAAQSGASVSGLVLFDDRQTIITKVTLIDSNGTITTTSTNTNGKYEFSGLKPGKYEIYADYPTQLNVPKRSITGAVQKFELLENQQVTLDLNFVIRGPDARSTVKPIREYVSVSTGDKQLIEEISKSVNIIGGQEMRERADFSLADSLRTIPGFRVQQSGGFGRTASIKTRGLRNQDTAILIDGIRFRDASSITGDASAFISDFTLTSISRIEVLRGSGSSIHGTNAIGGVVDFQTPRPQKNLHGQFSTAFGGLGLQRYRGNLSDATENEKIGYTIGISRTLYTKGIDGDDDAHNTNFQSRVEFNPTERTNVSGRLFLSDAFVKLNTGPDAAGTLPALNSTVINAVRGTNFTADVNDPDSFQRSKSFSGQIALTHVFNEKLILRSWYQGLKTSRKNDNGVLGTGFQSQSTSIFDGQIHTANSNLKWSPTRNNEITFGYEFEAERYRNDGISPNPVNNFSTRAAQNSHTLYVQDLLGLFNERLQLAGGVRAQFFQLDRPTFSALNAPYSGITTQSPTSALTFDGSVSYWFPRAGTKLRAHVGNGYRVPSLYERFGTFYSTFSSAFVALGDPNLEPEKTIAFDSGIDQSLFSGRASFSAVYFYTKLLNTVGYGNVVPAIGTTTRPFGGYLNTDGGRSQGGEFSASLKPTSSTDIFASYTYTDSKQKIPQVSGSGILQTLGVPKNQFTLSATQRYKRFWVNLDVTASDSYLAPLFSNSTFSTYVFRFKGNRRADLTAGNTFALKNEKVNLRLFGTIENLFGYEYFENGFQTQGRNARVGMSFSF